MDLFIIKRNDGKYYTGKGQKTYKSDPSWKNEIHSASIYKKVYLDRALNHIEWAYRDNDYKFEVIKIKIVEVEE